MSRNVGTHSLERAIHHLQVGGALALDARRASAGYDSLQELEHQFQIPISGTAASGIAWTTVNLTFDVTFVFAPEQRDSPLAVPHFSFGPVVSGEPASGTVDPNNPDALVMVTAQVTDWSRGHSDTIDGARVGVGAWSGGEDVLFQGYVHLTFQGYGAVSEDTSAAPVNG